MNTNPRQAQKLRLTPGLLIAVLWPVHSMELRTGVPSKHEHRAQASYKALLEVQGTECIKASGDGYLTAAGTCEEIRISFHPLPLQMTWLC